MNPCPFCRVIPWYGEFPFRSSDERHEIACENPNCPVRVEVYAQTKESALAKWDTRTVDPLITQLGEALSGLLGANGRKSGNNGYSLWWTDDSTGRKAEETARIAFAKYQEVKL